jgi:hypothetical protein
LGSVPASSSRTSAPSTPFTYFPDCGVLYFFASSTASLTQMLAATPAKSSS